MPDIQKIYETADTEGDNALIILGVAAPNYGNEKDEEGIKQFLTDMYYAGKETYGLPAIATYEERILGRIHHARAA